MSHAHWDSGGGCGYRNMQMVLSCLLQMEPYSSLLADSEDIMNCGFCLQSERRRCFLSNELICLMDY